MAASLTADEVIAHLKLGPHPEGGYFRETFRDEGEHQGRPHSTAILYLLRAGEVARWHRVDAPEMWHWYGGDPLLNEVKQGGTRHEYRLGPIGSEACTRTPWCRPAPGRPPGVSGPGRSPAAPWRPALTSLASKSLLTASSPNP